MTTVYGKKYGRFIETPLDWAACGTEQPCEACRRAANEARARRRRRAS